MTDGPVPEFSRPVQVDRIGIAPLTERLEATTAECARLARRMRLKALNRLACEVTLVRERAGLIRVDGDVTAEVAQTCVVSLEPFTSTIGEAFTVYFAELEEEEELADDVDLLDDTAWPEPIEHGVIDLGETVAQQLSLALDPHPRAPGATVDTALLSGDEDESDNPFKALAAQLSGSKEKE